VQIEASAAADLLSAMGNHEVESSIVISSTVVWVIQGLKGIKSRHPNLRIGEWFEGHSRKLSVILAMLQGAGFTFYIDGDMWTGTSTITIPPLMGLIEHSGFALAIQQALYHNYAAHADGKAARKIQEATIDPQIAQAEAELREAQDRVRKLKGEA